MPEIFTLEHLRKQVAHTHTHTHTHNTYNTHIYTPTYTQTHMKNKTKIFMHALSMLTLSLAVGEHLSDFLHSFQRRCRHRARTARLVRHSQQLHHLTVGHAWIPALNCGEIFLDKDGKCGRCAGLGRGTIGFQLREQLQVTSTAATACPRGVDGL